MKTFKEFLQKIKDLIADFEGQTYRDTVQLPIHCIRIHHDGRQDAYNPHDQFQKTITDLRCTISLDDCPCRISKDVIITLVKSLGFTNVTGITTFNRLSSDVIWIKEEHVL